MAIGQWVVMMVEVCAVMKFAEFTNLWFACLTVDGGGSPLTFYSKVRTVMIMKTCDFHVFLNIYTNILA